MKTHLPVHLRYTLITAVCLLTVQKANAQQELAAHFERYHNTEKISTPPTVAGLTRRAEKQRLLDFLKELNVPAVPYNEPADKQWNKLAGLFTRLKLYPLAMKCYLKTLTPDSLVNDDIPVTGDDQLSVASQLKQLGKNTKAANSSIIQVNHILETFHDGKSALAYAMILHVKQPIRGTTRVHKLANTGHTFITLIKFNTDSSYTTLSFGFGPRKDNLLSATPLIPSTSSKFTDDGSHEWDEVVGKFISKRRFEKILELTHQYDGLAYHLSTNNCTDFGLKAAQMAGLNISDTKGTWLLGGGNNPANTGESILLGKFSNADTGNLDQLYIDTAQTIPINLNKN
ncbi:hypothetical protein [Mucilaginibacter sp. dw_454]|uniref:hypothetical protein n=1 Tax=Mucilaginibacter sp. dw_454 TaxID=2720079 RepID=UPI001BD60243|nr:hypothetical protein [Mucilaginibacter sp. dw_454]